MQEGQADIDMPGYHMYLHSALRKGYSGVITYTKEALSVQKGIGDERFDEEGRALTLEFKDFYSVNVYVPNSQEKLVRLPYRLSWEECFWHTSKIRTEKTGHHLRRYECCQGRDRPEKSEKQSLESRFFRCGARKDAYFTKQRFH